MEVRRILEECSAEITKCSPILTEAYGTMLFKCPIISCTRFYQGFATRQQRDKHLRRHERAHKCTYEGCDYRELGFPTEVELRKHVELCHNASPEEPAFPNVQRVNMSKALNDAIDRDDAQAVRDICSEISVFPPRQTGFVLRAVKRRSISTALVLIELLGTDIEMNHKDSKGRTALHEAVQIRNDDLFDRILDTDINVDVRDLDRLTPFLRALQQGYFHAIRLLMDHAAVNLMPDDRGAFGSYYKSMQAAAAGGVGDVVKALFSNYASLLKFHNTSDYLTRIIAKAASNRHESTVKLILELAHALDLERMYNGLLRKELHHGIQAMTTFLMHHYGEAKREIGKDGKTYGNALANAALKDDSALVMRLLKDGADIDYADAGLAYNALGAAASRGHLSMVNLLVEQGADINSKGGYYGNALYLACLGKHMAVVDFLLEKGADVNARLMKDDTALIMASSRNRSDVVQFFIGKAADVNLQSKSGETALFSASRYSRKEIIEILVQQGADINIQNKSGETALFQASRYGFEHIVDILVQAGADVNLQNKSGETALIVAFERGKREVVQVLIKAEVDLEVKDSHQRTALLQAAERGWDDIVHILIDKGADIDSVDADQQTALLIASKKGHVEIVRILLASGARGWETALSTAFVHGHADDLQLLLEQASPSQQRTAVQLFLKLDSNVCTHGGAYDNALSSACSTGLEAFVKILLEEAQFKIPVEIYDRGLGLIGTRRYLAPHKYEAIAKLLRESRAITALQD